MRSLFAAKINQAVNTLIDSDTITLSGIGNNVPLTLINGTVYRNGVSVSSVNVSDGDTLRMRIRSSTGYATPQFAIIKIGTEETIFSVVTLPDPVPVPVTGGDTVLPFDVTKYSDGRDYVPSQASNEVSVFSDGALVTKVPLKAPAVNTNKTTDAIMIANYFGDNVFVLDSSLAVIAAVNTGAGSKPYGMAVTQTTLFDDDALTWITLSGTNRVVVLNKNYATVATYGVGSRPMGIASSADRRHVYVANYGSGTVSHFQYRNGAWVQSTVNVGVKPYELIVDADGSAWVICSDDKVYRVSTSNAVASFTPTETTGLRGITLAGDGTIWVAGSKSNTIAQLSAAGALLKTIETNVYPYGLNTAPDGSIQVATFGTSQVYSYAADGTVTGFVDVDKMPYGMTTYNGQMLVANLYANTPDYATPKDQTPDLFALADPVSIPKKLIYQSTPVTVSGLNVACTAAVPDVFGAKLVKNGSVVGSSVSVVNNDVLRVQFTAPDAYGVPINIPLYIGNVSDTLVTQTDSMDLTPDLFEFEAVPDAVPDTDYLSNEITISGISDGGTIPFSIDAGIIVLNGVELTVKATMVKGGDKIRVKMRSSSTDRETLYVNASAGITDATAQPVRAIWRITTKLLIRELWIIPSHKGLDEFEPTYPANISAAGRYITRINFGNSIQSIPIANTLEARIENALLIPSYHDGAVYQLNTGFKLLPAFAQDTNKKPVDIAANRFVAYTGANNRIMDVSNGNTTTLPGVPRKLIYDSATDTIYVSMSNNSIAQLKQVNAHYDIVRTWTIPNSAPYALQLADNGVLWFSDVRNNVLRSIEVDGTLSATTIAAGQGIWDMAINGGTMWTANSYDNTISKVDLASRSVQTIKSGWVPSQIEVDSNGNVWVGNYASKNVLKYDPSGTQIFEAKMQYAAPTYMTKYDGSIYVTELYADIVERQEKVSVLKPLMVGFKDAYDALVDELVKSNVVTVTGLIRPTEAFIEPNNNYELYVNGKKVPSGSALIDNGDTVQLIVKAAHTTYTVKLATLNDFQSSNTFLVRTESNSKPDLIAFADLYGAIPQVDVESFEALIKGMDEGVTTTLHVSRVGWKVKVNGGIALDEVQVKNGDVITIIGPSRASYTNSDTLDSKSAYPLIAGRHGFLVGTWVVHGRVIENATLSEVSNFTGPVVEWDARWSNDHQYESSTIAAYDVGYNARRLSAELLEADKRPRIVLQSSAAAVYDARTRNTMESSTIALFDTKQRVATMEFEGVGAEYRVRKIIGVEPAWTLRDASASTYEIEPSYERKVSQFIAFEKEFEQMPRRFVDVESQIEVRTVTFKELQSLAIDVRTHTFVDVAPEYEWVSHRAVESQDPQFSMDERSRFEVETLFEANANRHRIEIESKGIAEQMRAAYLYSEDLSEASVLQRRYADVPTVIEKSPYNVHFYNLSETTEVEGAFTTPQLAVAAGIAAGYPLAFAVEMRPNRFVWASPIDDGDMCGLPIPPDNLNQTNARGYVQGG